MKQRLKGLLALVLSLVMVFALATNAWAAVWIGSTELTSGVAFDGNQGTATYDDTTKTLTLNNFVYEGTYGINADSDLTIDLIGNNKITYSSDSGNASIAIDGNLTITSSDPSAEVTADFDINRSGVNGGGIQAVDLSIKGGIVTAISTKDGIKAGGDLTIKDATVTATGGDNDDGIDAQGNITITGATVNATGGNSDGNGIFAGSEITIEGGTVTAKGWWSGINATDITIKNATVTAESDTYGIYSNNAITISGTNTEVTVGCTTGLQVDTVNITGGSTVSITADTTAINSNTLKTGGNWYQWSTDNTNFTDSTTTALTKEIAVGTATLYIKPAPGGGAPTPQPPAYYPIYIPTVEDEPEVTAPNTFDGGIASAVVVTILSATGGAWLAKKKD